MTDRRKHRWLAIGAIIVALLSGLVWIWRRHAKERILVIQQTTPLFVFQMMNPPPSSVAALEPAATARPVANVREALAAQDARYWLTFMLKPAFQPPATTPFFALPSEGGAIDVVRARYVASETTIDVAQTQWVAAVVTTPKPDELSLACLERVRSVANRVLATTSFLDLVETDGANSISHGTRRGPRLKRNPYWEDDFEWWCTNERVVFVAVKALGYSLRAYPSFDESENARWFDALPDKPSALDEIGKASLPP